MTVYISGPITGIKDNNRTKFKKAVSEISKLCGLFQLYDIEIINPLNLGAALDKQFALSGEKPEWTDYMRACIKKLVDADLVFLLDGWETSDGAALEWNLALRLGIPCVASIGALKKILEGKK